MSDIKTLFGILSRFSGKEKAPEEEITTGEAAPDMESVKKMLARAMTEEMSKVSAAAPATPHKDAFPSGFADAVAAARKEPEMKVYKRVSRMSWAWEVENSADSDEINDLLSTHTLARDKGNAMAIELFERTAKRAGADKNGETYIDIDGTNLPLPYVPYSPYTDEGAAFFISLAYNWRAMAEEWNLQEDDRKKEHAHREAAVQHARREKEQRDLAEYFSKQTEKMIRETLLKDGRDDKIDAMPIPEFFKSQVLGTFKPESSGIDKIANALAHGALDDLKKERY